VPASWDNAPVLSVYAYQHLSPPAGREPIAWFREICAARGATEARLRPEPAGLADLARALELWPVANEVTSACGSFPVKDAAADLAARVSAWPGLDCREAKLSYVRKVPTSAPWSPRQPWPPVIEVSTAGIDLRSGAWWFRVSLDCSVAARRSGEGEIWNSLNPWWTPRRMVIGAELAEAAGVALPYRIVHGRVRNNPDPTSGLVSYWQYAEEQWALMVPDPPGGGIAGLQRMLRAFGFHERQPSVSATAAQILSLRSWLGEGDRARILGAALWDVRVPLEAIAIPPAWRGKAEWRVRLALNETPPDSVDDIIGPLELVLAASRAGIRIRFQMRGGLGRAGARWIAERLGGQAGVLRHG
jgi:hypothetical protein